jgi:hypothetical protein
MFVETQHTENLPTLFLDSGYDEPIAPVGNGEGLELGLHTAAYDLDKLATVGDYSRAKDVEHAKLEEAIARYDPASEVRRGGVRLEAVKDLDRNVRLLEVKENGFTHSYDTNAVATPEYAANRLTYVTELADLIETRVEMNNLRVHGEAGYDVSDFINEERYGFAKGKPRSAFHAFEQYTTPADQAVADLRAADVDFQQQITEKTKDLMSLYPDLYVDYKLLR